MLALKVDPNSLSAEGDVAYANGSLLTTGYDLETAIILSLFTDAEDITSTSNDPRRGWWANAFGAGLRGSKLWLIEQMPASQATAKIAEGYAQEALQWLVTSKVVKSVTTSSSFKNESIILSVSIQRNSGNVVQLGPFKVGA